MRLLEKIREWITSEKYLKPGREVDKWLEMRYYELIKRLEEKYPEGTIAGVSTKDFDIVKIFKAYKIRFGCRYNRYDLHAYFIEFWNNSMQRDTRLQTVWSLDFPSWELVERSWNRHNCVIWNNRKEEITVEYVKEYFDRYIKESFSDEVFADFKGRYPNSLAEANSKKYKASFRICENPHLMAIKCFGNLTYKEVYEYFKAALKPAEKFEVTLSDTSKDFKEYKGFPENREDRYDGVPYEAWIRVSFYVSQMRS